MSDVEAGETPERKKKEKKEKKEKRHRTDEEKEERRRRKEAERNASANADAPASPGDAVHSPSSRSLPPSASAKKTAWDDDLEKGKSKSKAGDGDDGDDDYDGPAFVPPSKALALKHARESNVMRRRAGISVFIESDALVDMDEDEIMGEVYGQCERRGIAITKIVKTSRREAQIEDVVLSQAADLVAMGLTIGGQRVACVKEELPQAGGEGGGDGGEAAVGEDGLPDLSHPYVLGKTGVAELGELGVGIGLYFHSLLWGFRVLGALSVVGALTTVTYVMAGVSSAQLQAEKLTYFAIPTLGAVAWAGGNGHALFAGKDWDAALMLAVAVIESLIAVAFIFLVNRMRKAQTKTIEAIDVSNISLQDYAVKVDYLPKEELTPEEIGTFFSKFGRVHMVVLGTDVGSLIGRHKKRAALGIERETLTARVAKARGKNAGLNKKLAGLEKRLAALDASIEKAQRAKAGRPTCAFVTFETEEARLLCERKMRPDSLTAWFFRRKKYRFRGTHRLWIHRAPEASDVLWENLGVEGASAAIRKAIAWLFMIVLLVCTCALVVLAESAQSTQPPAISCETPAADGTLACDAIWPASATSGDASKTILVEMQAFVDQVDAVQCASFVGEGEWLGDASKFAPYAAVGQDNLYDASSGEWTGGFDSSTLEDECAAMACFDCFCKSRVVELLTIAVGSAADTDGYFALCEGYFRAQGLGLATSGFTAVLNVLLGEMTRLFSQFECHHTKSGMESSVSVKLFLALVINSALIPVLVFAKITKFDFIPYLFAGPYADFEPDWYQRVAATLSTTLVVNALVFPVTALSKGFVKYVTRVLFASGAVTQRQLDAMYEGDDFDLSERYAQLVTMLFVALTFQAAMPLLVPITALFCLMTYHEGKYTLLRSSKRPPEYDETMAKFFWAFTPSSSFAKLALSAWMFSYYTIPRFGFSLPTYESLLAVFSEDGAQFDFRTRLTRSNGAASFFTLLLVVLGYVLNANRGVLRAAFRRCFPSTRVFEEEEPSSVPDFSIALSDGILKGFPTYMIAANPEYNEIVPGTSTVPAGGPNNPIPKAWEEVLQGMSAEEEQRLAEMTKKMTMSFVPEAAQEYSKEMRDMLGKKDKKKSKKRDDDSSQLTRKNSTVAPLGWGDDDRDVGASFDGGGEDRRGFESVRGVGGVSEAMATQPEGDPEEVREETREEKEERRRKKREKKERRRREREAGGDEEDA